MMYVVVAQNKDDLTSAPQVVMSVTKDERKDILSFREAKKLRRDGNKNNQRFNYIIFRLNYCDQNKEV